MEKQQESSSNTSCSMTGLLGILIQVGLGVLSFSILIIKRLRQKPQRPWKIWFFDTSKQLISQAIAHFINLTISIALTYNDDSSDQCLWYFMTNILDNTLGVLICILSLKAIQWSLARRNYYTKKKIIVQIQIMDLTKGEVKDTIQVDIDHSDDPTPNNQMHEEKEDDAQQPQSPIAINPSSESKEQRNSNISPPETQFIDKYQINYKAWLIQLFIWVSIVVLAKIVLFSLQFALQNPLKTFSFLILGWIQNYPIFQLFVVLVFVPVIMNGLAFWIQDNFLMKKEEELSDNSSPLIQEQTTQKEYHIEL